MKQKTKQNQQTDKATLEPVKDLTLEAAKAAHEANRAYCESIGDTSQVPWDEAPEWQQKSAIDGVKFAMDNDFPSPESMHENWMKDKIVDGWVYGDVKDATAKTHPCIRPYGELSEEQRMKDDIFRTTIMDVLTAPVEPEKTPASTEVLPPGIVYLPKRNSYHAEVKISGQMLNVGNFPSLKAAEAAVNRVKAEYYP